MTYLIESITTPTPVETITDKYLIGEIQTLLKAGSFYNGNIDGILGSQTLQAFKEFKKAAYLEYPGLIGESTVKALLEIVGIGERAAPKEPLGLQSKDYPQGKSFKLPKGDTVLVGDPIPGSAFFNWGEATHGGDRIPANSQITANIIALAKYLDMVRAFFGERPLIVVSWYRPPAINKAVGGVGNSTHLEGNGVDFLVVGIPPLEVFKRLNNWHGARGGLGKSSAFTHLDLRGYPARWKYN